MAAELPRPGVEVIQVFRTVTPTVVTPTLVPCIVGVCKQIVDVLVPSAAGGSQLNPQALVQLPAFFRAAPATGTPAAYTGLDTLQLVLSITNGPDVPIVFSGASLSPSSVVAQISAAFVAAGVTEATVELTPDNLSFRVRTLGVGEFSLLEVRPTTSAAVATAFGIKIGNVFAGATSYAQLYETIPLLSFPDPRQNLSQLAIEPASVRVFLGLGSGANLYEASRTQAFLRRGGGGSAAQLVGSVALSTGGLYGVGGQLDGKSLSVTLDGGLAPVVILMGVGASAPKDASDLLDKVNLALGGLYGSDVGVGLALTSRTLGTASSVLAAGTAAGPLGLSATAAVGLAGVKVADDGNGDALSPLIDIVGAGADFISAGTAAQATGLVDLTTLTFGALIGQTVTIQPQGKRAQTFTFVAPLASDVNIVTELNGYFGADLLLTEDGSHHLIITSLLTGFEGQFDILGGTALGALGLVPSLTGTIDLTTLLPDLTVLNTKKVKFNLGGTLVEHTFSGLTNISTVTDVVAALNADAAFALVAVASVATGNKVRVRLLLGGSGKSLQAVPASSNEAAYFLGFDTSAAGVVFSHFVGNGLVPSSGDDLYVDGALVGRITAVAPGAIPNRLRIDKQLPINANYGTNFFIRAKNLVVGASGRPTPELVVDSFGSPTLKNHIMRDTTGAPIAGTASVYLAYSAVREDVTAKAVNPGLLRFSSTTDLTSSLSPVSILNPLALGMYFALLNAPGAQVSGLGVDEIAANAPFGTVAGFTRAAEALEAYEVYAIAPLTHDQTVAQVFNTHVTAMSQPASKGERVCLFNFNRPTKKLDKLVASGLTGNSVGAGGTQFDTGVVNLAALVLNQGINPVGTLLTAAGLFLSIADSSLNYSVASIAGGVVTIRTTFAAGENDDGFYSTTALNVSPLPLQLINEAFAIRVRGADLENVDKTPDKQGMSETMQALTQTYLNRRFWSIVPDQTAATLAGIEQVIDGFYLCAAIAGMIGQQPPQQSFTNFPMTGFTRVIGSNDYFTEKQLNIIAAGGNYIVVQDTAGAPLISRMALTTDMTSLETRTDSITKIVDFVAKFMRKGLRAYIGRFNITQGFLDSLGHVIQGLLGFLTDIGVLIGANMNNIVQDASAPDTVLIDVTLDVPFPCNYIRLTLVI